MTQIPHITPKELKEWMDSGADFQLIDVREPYEHEMVNIGGTLIPMGTVLNQIEQIERDKKVVIYCHSGRRSGDIVRILQQHFGYDNLLNLRGGILAWSDEVDPTVKKY